MLDEIVVGPENTKKFLDLKKEEFSRVDYTQDKSTQVDNVISRQKLVNGPISSGSKYWQKWCKVKNRISNFVP